MNMPIGLGRLPPGPGPVGVGVIVPFQDAALLGVRVRPDPQTDLVALLPDFGTLGAFGVLPWGDLAKSFTLQPPDQALHEQVRRTRAITPLLVGRAARLVAASGAAGAEAQREARAAIARDSARAADTGEAMLLRLLGELDFDFAALRNTAFLDDDMISPLLSRALASRALQPGRLRAAMDELFGLIAPVGLPGSWDNPLAGPQRVLSGEIARIAGHLARRQARASGEAWSLYTKLQRRAEQGAAAAGALLGEIDAVLDPLVTTLAQWEARRGRLADIVQQLAWVLDGWEPAFAHYTRSEDATADLPDTAMLRRLLALVPAR